MTFKIIEDAPDVLPEYEKISIAFRVESRFRVELSEKGLGGIKLREEPVKPYVKDYDEHENYRPSQWAKRFDMSRWGILSAFEGKTRVGGAAIVCDSPEIEMLEGLKDLACLWDLRVHPDFRNRGVGHRLFTRALVWSQKRHCRRIKIETQNINVPACRFYARQNCELAAINRFAYPEILSETQLIWYRNV